MPSLLSLPVEILQQTTDNLYHSDIESITLSCRYLYNVLTPSLERHRSLKRRFSKLNCGGLGRSYLQHDCTGPHPADILLECLSYEPVHLYPTDLSIGICSHPLERHPSETCCGNLQPDMYAFASGNRLGERYDELNRMISNLSIKAEDFWETRDALLERVLAYHRGPTVALLLQILPNVQRLTYDGFRSNYTQVLSIVQEIARRSHADPNTVHPLSRLHTLEVPAPQNRCTEHYQPFYLIAPFIGLPSL